MNQNYVKYSTQLDFTNYSLHTSHWHSKPRTQETLLNFFQPLATQINLPCGLIALSVPLSDVSPHVFMCSLLC